MILLLVATSNAAPTCKYTVQCRCEYAPTFMWTRRSPANAQVPIVNWWTEEITDLELALHAWDEVPLAQNPFSLYPYAVRMSAPLYWINNQDGYNSVVRWAAGTWAFGQGADMATRSFYFGNCGVVEADIHIRDPDFGMLTGPDDLNVYFTQGQVVPPPGGWQERSILAHELGHTIGFGHSTDEDFPELMYEHGELLDIDHQFGLTFAGSQAPPATDKVDLHVGPLEGFVLAKLYPDPNDNPRDIALVPWRVLDENPTLLHRQNEVWNDAFAAAEGTDWTHTEGTTFPAKDKSIPVGTSGFGPATLWLSNRGLTSLVDVIWFISPYPLAVDCHSAYSGLKDAELIDAYTLLREEWSVDAWSMTEGARSATAA